MKLAERHLAKSLVRSILNPLSSAMQEKYRNPSGDIWGPFVGRLSIQYTGAFASHSSREGKLLGNHSEYCIPLAIITGAGVAYSLAGKSRKHWVGDYVLFSSAMTVSYLTKCYALENKVLPYFIAVVFVGCLYALEKLRTPSLAVAPYLIHGVVYTLLKMCTKTRVMEITNDRDIQCICGQAYLIGLSYFLAAGIQSTMGATTLKFDWKSKILLSGAMCVSDLFFTSKRSPIYEE